ncbi:MAG TPA: hydrogenase maturation protease [Opitutaceae bacterium]|nr:hydrogenase maturation protease [Opitutaceae bacterium]
MTTRRQSHYLADLLVIGYGNTLRRDDGVGPRVAEAIEEKKLPRVWTLSLPQLAPEHGECLSRVKVVIFVDAAIDVGEVRLRSLKPATSSRVTTHAVSAPTVLAIAREYFDRAPRAWMLTIPGSDFSFGEELSPVASKAVDKAVAKIVEFVSPSKKR